MKILFAASDRDLLDCCRKLLSEDFGETVTAFEGTRVMSLISEEQFDAAIIDFSMPRIECEKLIQAARFRGIPVITTLSEEADISLLTSENAADEYLTYPFAYRELKDILSDLLEKAGSSEIIRFSGLEIEVSKFRFTDGPHVTAGEINTLKDVLDGRAIRSGHEIFTGSINLKLARCGANARIEYIPKKGYRLVTENE